VKSATSLIFGALGLGGRSAVDHYTQRFVWIRYDGMCLYNLSELALVSALVRVQ